VAQLLLKHKADVNAADGDGKTPLHFADENGHKEVLVMLLAKMEKDFADSKLIQQLLKKAGKGDTEDSRTLLHVAAELGYVAVVKMLVKNGAKLDEKDALERTPLDIADEMGHWDVVETLLGLGANKDEFQEYATVVDLSQALRDRGLRISRAFSAR
jgi:serine/threonine-protein phosphatase 6 regulatory ankyrin repeat subunit B